MCVAGDSHMPEPCFRCGSVRAAAVTRPFQHASASASADRVRDDGAGQLLRPPPAHGAAGPVSCKLPRAG